MFTNFAISVLLAGIFTFDLWLLATVTSIGKRRIVGLLLILQALPIAAALYM